MKKCSIISKVYIEQYIMAHSKEYHFLMNISGTSSLKGPMARSVESIDRCHIHLHNFLVMTIAYLVNTMEAILEMNTLGLEEICKFPFGTAQQVVLYKPELFLEPQLLMTL